jgi:hypothetical protein
MGNEKWKQWIIYPSPSHFLSLVSPCFRKMNRVIFVFKGECNEGKMDVCGRFGSGIFLPFQYLSVLRPEIA